MEPDREQPSAAPESFAKELLQTECIRINFTMLLQNADLFQMINKTKYKLPSSSAYNEWSPVKSVSAVVPYKCLPAGADF